jgi:hypothetical protein
MRSAMSRNEVAVSDSITNNAFWYDREVSREDEGSEVT